jgi:predicted DsbA family dithiol-disulfide isomerase
MKVEFFADILCPWCYIAKRRLDSARRRVPQGERLEIVWRGFQLDPGMAKKPGATAEEMLRRWRGDRAEARIRLIRNVGLAEGLELNLDRARPVNTLDAHRLMRLAADHDLAQPMAEGLFRAYHTEGHDIADGATLEKIAAEAGLPPDAARRTLSGDGYHREIEEDRRHALELGISGVPMLLIGNRLVPGLMPLADLQRLLEAPAATWG